MTVTSEHQSMAKFLIVGCGDIGTRVGRSLVEKGHQVWGLKRNPPVNEHIQYIQADITSAEDIQSLPTHFDQIIYIVTPNGRDESAYNAIFKIGVENILSHFSKHSPKTTSIFVSSTRVYGQQTGEWVDEDSETIPLSIQGKILLAAEKEFLKQHSNNTVVRFSGIYGRSTGSFFMRPDENGAVQFQPPYYTNRIHYTDCVAFLVYLAQLKCNDDSNAGKPKLDNCYLVSDDHPCTKWEVVNALRPISNNHPIKKKNDPNALQNKRCSNNRIKSLGYQLLVKNYREGYNVDA